MLLRSRCEGVPGSNAPVRCAPLHGSPGIHRTCTHRRRPRCRHSPRSARTPLRVPVASERTESTQQSAPVGVYVFTDHAAILAAVDRTLTLRPSLSLRFKHESFGLDIKPLAKLPLPLSS